MKANPTLFDDYNFDSMDQSVSVAAIRDLQYVPDYISEFEHDNLIKKINSSDWMSDIRRRVQHYGWKYDYKARSIDYKMFLGELPEWAHMLAERLLRDGYISELPDQVIVNEYLPGQGIANHVDCTPCFTDTVISISLGSRCVMDFINLTSKAKIEVLLEPKSLVVIRGEARYRWSHGIASRKCDLFNGIRIDRGTRVSMTFRKVIVNKHE